MSRTSLLRGAAAALLAVLVSGCSRSGITPEGYEVPGTSPNLDPDEVRRSW